MTNKIKLAGFCYPAPDEPESRLAADPVYRESTVIEPVRNLEGTAEMGRTLNMALEKWTA